MAGQVTVIEYVYADNGNNKCRNTVYLPGALTEEQIDAIHADMRGGEFLPEQVGLPALQDQTFVDEDHAGHHIWHELDHIEVQDDRGEVSEFDPRRPMTAQQFADQFDGIVWDEAAAKVALTTLINDMAW